MACVGIGLAKQLGEEGDGIFSRVLGEGFVGGQLGAGGEEIVESDERIVGGVGGDVAWPTDDERHAVAAFERGSFVAVELTGGHVVVGDGGGAFFGGGLERTFERAVVGGDDEECVVGDIQIVERLGDATRHPIDEPNKIAARPGV